MGCANWAEMRNDTKTPKAGRGARATDGAEMAPPFRYEGAARPVLGRLLRLCWRHRRGCVTVIVCQVVLLALGLVGLGFTGLGIDFLRSELAGEGEVVVVAWPLGIAPPATWAPMTVMVVIAGTVVVAAALRGVLSWAAGVTLARFVHGQVVAELQSAVHARLQRLSFRFLDKESTGAIINRATGDVQAVRTFVETVLIQSFVTVVSVALYAAYMARLHLGLTLACLASLPVLWAACVVFSQRVHPLYKRGRELFDDLVRLLAESVQGVQTVKGFAREAEMGRRFEGTNEAVRKHQRRIFWHVSVFSPSIDTLTNVNLLVLLLYGGHLVMAGELPLGTGLVVFAGLLQQFSNQVSTIAQIANGVQESLTGARRVFEILDAPLEVASPAAPVRPAAWRGAVRFAGAGFAHVEATPVLREIELEIAAGACVAVVGETGSGKTALLSLIPRFYDVTAGRVLIDGVDVRELDLGELRRRVAVVFQESFLFSASVASNIALGRPEATRAEIEAAAKMAAAHDFIMELAEGYETVLGESGVDLSGGQRQRLAIARALLQEPAILLLDDPTAAIDPETEHEVLTAIARATEGRTTLVVAHRLSTLRRADVVIVLEAGRIVQRGTHAALMAEAGPYRRAARLQMADEASRRALAEPVPSEETEAVA